MKIFLALFLVLAACQHRPTAAETCDNFYQRTDPQWRECWQQERSTRAAEASAHYHRQQVIQSIMND
jgi:hypothetical protein